MPFPRARHSSPEGRDPLRRVGQGSVGGGHDTGPAKPRFDVGRGGGLADLALPDQRLLQGESVLQGGHEVPDYGAFVGQAGKLKHSQPLRKSAQSLSNLPNGLCNGGRRGLPGFPPRKRQPLDSEETNC